jgi:phosphoglycerol transferase MdoB-like AlkP superfamily enzyme
MEMNIETISALALGIGLSASTGFRVFIPLLVAGIASHFGLLPLGESFEWMGSVPALISFGVATVVEVLAYYIPFVDNLLDSIATPLSVGAGTLLMTSVFPAENEWIKWIMGFVVGGGAAATIQSGSAFTRLLSTSITAGTGNPVVSTGEGVAATGFSIMSLFTPILVAVLLVILMIILLRFAYRRMVKKRKKELTTLSSEMTE